MGKLRILVADDDDSARTTLVHLCQSLGHHVVGEAANGQEAIDLADQGLPDLALLDIRMPEVSGLEAARVITHRWSVPVIIITGHSDESLIREAAETGALNYILKPLTRERLAAAIAVGLARSSELRGLRQEVVELKQSLEDRKLIERAKGILMRDMNVGEQEAFFWLKRTSSHRNARLGDIARRVVALELNRGSRP